MACPDYKLCERSDCNQDGVCLNGDYWSAYWKTKRPEVTPIIAIVAKEPVVVEIEVLFCCYCERELLLADKTREHIIPRSRGGGGHPLNIRPCCTDCNNERGNTPYREWLIELMGKIIYFYPAETKERCRRQHKNASLLLDYIRIWGPALYKDEENYFKFKDFDN